MSVAARTRCGTFQAGNLGLSELNCCLQLEYSIHPRFRVANGTVALVRPCLLSSTLNHSRSSTAEVLHVIADLTPFGKLLEFLLAREGEGERERERVYKPVVGDSG